MLTAERIAQLYRRYASEVLRFLARRTLEPEVAVDLLAETFARAIADRARFRGSTDEQAIAWIYMIARNQLIDYQRRDRVQRDAMWRLGMQRRPLGVEEHDEIERMIDLGAVRAQVAEALQSLPEAQREALRLRVLEERSYSEVAALLGISEQAARARVSRALGGLRETVALPWSDGG